MSDMTIYFPKKFVANRYVAHKCTLVVRWVMRCGRNMGMFSPKILSNDRSNTTISVTNTLTCDGWRIQKHRGRIMALHSNATWNEYKAACLNNDNLRIVSKNGS